MIIELKKFGTILLSRPAGREAFSAIRPQIKLEESNVQVDFSNVFTLTPSWADEFLTLLLEYTNGRVELLPTDNSSVIATLRILVEANQGPAADIARRFLSDNKKE